MTTPDVHTLTGPYVLDALPDAERAAFEEHLVECEACATEMEELREAAVKLATQVSTPPPPALKADVMAAIDQVRQLPPLVPDRAGEKVGGTVIAPRRGFGRRSLLALAAAALAVVASGGIAFEQYRDNAATQQANDQIAAVLAEPDARTVHGTVAGGGQVAVVTSSIRLAFSATRDLSTSQRLMKNAE